MDQEKVPAVIIGGGVIGAAIAQNLSSRGLSSVTLEAGPRVAEGVTSRNSGVIHAAIYYPPESLKARTCLRGKTLLKEWCSKTGVPWRETGKWIIAQSGDEASLEDTFKNAIASGATGLSRKTGHDIAQALPQVQGAEAIFSSETGIVDAAAFTHSLFEHAGENILLTNAKVTGVEKVSDGYQISSTRGEITCERVFNASGLECDMIAKLAGIDHYQLFPWRGDYFRINRDLGLSTLLYPSRPKNAPGLGIHLTIDLDGRAKLGPDVEPVEKRDDFSPREEKQLVFFEAARKYLPGLKLEDLSYDTCGIRPKLRAPNEKLERDFIVSEDRPGFVNLIGIESPGLTAAMALAELATDLVF